MRDRIQSILRALMQGAYERDEVISLGLLSALSGESIFMLGLPGVGKSMIARKLKLAFRDSTVFEYLMSRFSTPDEIFGPVSISKLKDEDCYERVINGYLPSAEVIFLDEIWKAGPAIQNSLLTVLNEKIYLNGNCELHLPAKAIIAASNEIPAEGEGLEALWDRFLIRYIVKPIKQRANFFRLIDGNSLQSETEVEFEPLTDEDYNRIRKESSKIKLPEKIREVLYELREQVNSMPRNPDEKEEDFPNKEKYYVSDRRWKKIVGVLKTSAYLNGRPEVNLSDILLLEFMLWDNDEIIPDLYNLVAENIVTALFLDVLKIYKNITVQKAAKKTGGKNLYSDDRIYYQILCDNFILKIRIEDYLKMLRSPKSYFFASETPEGCLILKEAGQYPICVSKTGYVCINSYNYPLVTTDQAHLSNPDFIKAYRALEMEIDNFKHSVKRNLFTSGSELYRLINGLIKVYRKRYDISDE